MSNIYTDDAAKDQLVALAKDLERRSDVEGSAVAHEAHGYIVYLERRLETEVALCNKSARWSNYNKSIAYFLTAVLGISWAAFAIYFVETVVFK